MEFDIRIGTLLDTSKAEEQLQSFISKYGEENDFKINLKISGDEKLEGIEKSLNNIKTLAKSISNIKMDFDGGGVNVDTAFNKTIEKAKKEIQDFSKEFGSQAGNGVEDSVKNISKNLDKEIDNTKKKIESMVKNLENLKLNPFADSNEIDKMITSLKEMGSMSFEDFPNLKLMAIKEEIESITKAYSDLQTTAKNKQLDDIFQTTKVEPLRQQILALKEVLDFKGMDTSSLDKLLQDLKKTSEYGNDLKKVKSIFADVKSSFGNIQKSMGEKGITSAETAIKRLLEYKEKIQEEIRMEVDTSKIQKAEEDIKKIDEAIDRLKINADESIVKNLFDMSELKNMENMEKVSKTLQNNLGKLGDVFDKLKVKASQLGKSEFIDISSANSMQAYIRSIDNLIKSIDFKNINAGEIEKVKKDLEGFEICIKHVQDAINRTELEIKFDTKLESVIKEFNGLQSALVKMGQSTSGLEQLEKNINDIERMSKVNLDKATSQLESFSKALKDMAKENNLGAISGDLNQYTKYVNDFVNSMKKIATTKDINFANAITEEIRQTKSALEQLESSFNDTERKLAHGFLDDALKGLSDKFGQEVNKIQTQADKLVSSLYKIGSGANFDDSLQANKLTSDLEQATRRVETLQNALRNLEIRGLENGEFTKLKQELEEAKNSVQELSKQRIELDCNQAIQKMEQLRNSVEDVDEALERIGGADAINRIVSDFENGVITFDKATASIKKFDDALDKIGDGSTKLSKSFDGVEKSGSKIEGIFGTISNAFSTFTLGELLEEGIENLAYGITETIAGLDQAMTELKRVSDDIDFGGDGYKQVANDAREVAISVGQSVEDVITGMATAYQAGANNIRQATEIARTSAILQNVSDMGAEEASQAIASLVNQYYSMDTALSKVQGGVKSAPADYNNLTNAIDQINYAGNNFAISSEGVTQALQNGGATLSAYGVTLSDSIAMITAANESMQDPARIGNGLRSIAVNFAGIKANAKTGTLELNKSAKALKEIAGINIFTDKSKTSVKDMTTLMEELYTKWGTLNEKEQLGLSEALAGKTQSAVFQSLMQNWDRVRQYQNDYKEGFMVGSAERENEIYLDSLAGKWNTLKETMKGVLTSNTSVDMFKGILEGGTKVVEVIGDIIEKLGSIGTFSVGAGLITLVSTLKNFTNYTSGITGLASVIGKLFNTIGMFSSSVALSGGSGIVGLITGFKNLATSGTVVKTVMAGVNAALNAISWAALIAAIGYCVKAWYDYAHATENAIKASKERQDEITNNIKSLSSEKEGLSQIADRYDELSRKTNKTSKELAEFSELKKQVAEISPDLVSGYDASGDPILKLNGSLKDYMADLDTAIGKQKELFNTETAHQSNVYQQDNNSGEMDKKVDEVFQSMADLSQTITKGGSDWKDFVNIATGGFIDIGDSAKGLVKTMRDYDSQILKNREANYKKMLEVSQEYMERDAKIQAEYYNDFMESTLSSTLGEKNTNKFLGFTDDLGWGDLGTSEVIQLSNALDTLATSTAFSKKEMGDFYDRTKEAFKTFENTGALNAYGQALQKIAQESDTFDITSWSGYLEEANQRLEDGTYTMKEYEYTLGIMADTLGELTGTDPSVWLEALTGSGIESLPELYNNVSSGLLNFLDAYDITATQLRNGDNFAELLQRQFEGLQNLQDGMMTQIETTGTIGVRWLLEQKGEDIPSQMNKLIDIVAKDGEVTEIEQNLLLACSMEIENEGQLREETISMIEQMLEGNFDVSKEVEIQGVRFSMTQLEELQSELKGLNLTAEDIANMDIGNLGLDGVIEEAKKVDEALKNLGKSADGKSFKDLFQKAGISNSVAEIEALKGALESIPKNKQVAFISECGSFFNDVNSVEEGMNKIPEIKRIKFGIGVEGNERLTQIKALIESLPKSIQAQVYAETFGIEDITLLQEIVKTFGETNATAILGVEGVQEAVAEAGNLKEFLQLISEGSWIGELDIESGKADEILKKIRTKLKELEKNPAKAKIEADTTSADGEIEEFKGKKEELEEPAEFELLVNGSSADETISEYITVKNELGEEVQIPITADNTSSSVLNEINQQKEEVEQPSEIPIEADGSQAKSEISTLITEKGELGKPVNTLMTIMVDGREQIQATINEKGQLEVDGQAKTHVYVEGLGQYSIAINDKGQLEVDGIAQTHIQVNNGEQLQICKNDKGQLEVNGQAVTDVKINGAEKPKEVAEAIEQIPDKKESSVSIKFDVNDALDSVLSRLGLSKKKETIEITVKAVDEASSTLDKINGYEGKTITFTITANGASEAAQQIQTISSSPITNKTFSITCTGGDAVSNQIRTISSTTIANKSFTVSANTGAVSSQLNGIATRTIPNKTFQITCNDSASAKISAITGRQIPTKTFNVICNDQATSKLSAVQNKNVQDKRFTVNCNDQASAKIAKVQSKKINNKSFSVSCSDNASGKLSGIISKLSAIRSKSITVTTTYRQIGKPRGGSTPSVTPPQVLTQGTAIPLTIDDGSVASTMSMARTTASAVNEAMASTKAKNYTDTILASKYWANQSKLCSLVW